VAQLLRAQVGATGLAFSGNPWPFFDHTGVTPETDRTVIDRVAAGRVIAPLVQQSALSRALSGARA